MSNTDTKKKLNSWAFNSVNNKDKAELLQAISKHKQIVSSYEATKPTLQSYSNCLYYKNIYVPANKSVQLPTTDYNKNLLHYNINLYIEQIVRKQAISGGYIPNIEQYKNPTLTNIDKIDKIEIHKADVKEKSDTYVKEAFNFKWWATITFKTSNSGSYRVQISGYVYPFELSFNTTVEESTKYKNSLDNISSLKTQLFSDVLDKDELSALQLISEEDCDQFISDLTTPIQKPITDRLKDMLSSAAENVIPGITKVVDNVIDEINKPPSLDRKITKVEVIQKPGNLIQRNLTDSEMRRNSETVSSTFDKRVHNKAANSDGDAYSLLTKLDRPGHIKMYPAQGDGYASPTKIDCFLTQSVQTSLREKFSIFQSLSGDVLAYFFGKQPVIYRFSAVLYNTYNQQWWHDFRLHYDRNLRGTAAIKKNIRTVVAYEDHVIEGFFLEMNSSQSTINPAAVNIDFSILLLQETILGDYSEPDDISADSESESSAIDTSAGGSGMTGISKPMTQSEMNTNNIQKMLSMVPAMTSFTLPGTASKVNEETGEVEYIPGIMRATALLEDSLTDIIENKTPVALKENKKPDLDSLTTKKNGNITEVTNKSEMNKNSTAYKKNDEAVVSAKKTNETKNNVETTLFGETVASGLVSFRSGAGAITIRVQPNSKAKSIGVAPLIPGKTYSYTKVVGTVGKKDCWYYVINPLGNGQNGWTIGSNVEVRN